MDEKEAPTAASQTRFDAEAPQGLLRTALQLQEIGRILAAPDVKEKFAAQGAEITYRSADEFDRFLAREREQWAQAVKVSGAKLD